MNLENLNLVELNTQEIESIEGGLFGWDDLALIVIGALVTQDWDNMGRAYRAGYAAA
ncbi:class IIb bacteriocin, lactobin A/cerein 7B family [Flavobacterium sp. DSP2-3-1]|uniref:class IIb bacteriocin, lactobin A/cerein 7B family n=1 Tax=Flavobacterium sp. DSP2-3-1 TaxID=2804620 RepID=UPI003CE7B3AF